MKRLKALPIIFYVLQTIPAYAAPAKEHFEILDMTNPAVIREMDRVYVMHPDQNSIQQGIRLYALAIQAWNPSYQNTNVRLKIMKHVEDQGVLNGLIAPSILLTEHALKTNDVAFAMSLITMVRHISPIFNSQLERKWKLPETSMNFAKFVTNSDEQISKYYGRLLGSDFQAYADGERKLSETKLRMSFRSSADNQSDLNSLIKKAKSKPVSTKTTAQDLIQDVLDKGSSKDNFAQDMYQQCLQFSKTKRLSQPTTQDNKKKAEDLDLEFKSLNNKCLNTEAFKEQNLNAVDFSSLIEKTWVENTDCDEFLQRSKDAKDLLRNKIEQDRSRYSDLNWACLRDCGAVTLPTTYSSANFGFEIGAMAAGPSGVVLGGAIGATFGTTVSLLSCKQMSSCGGDKIQNKTDQLALQTARSKAEEAKLQLEWTKEKIAQEREKYKADEDRRREAITRAEREKSLRDLGINEADIIHGVDSCSNSTCNSSNIVESDNSFNAYARNVEKENLKKKRIQDFYASRNNAIETNPKNVQDLWDPSSIALKNCIKGEWNKDFRNSGSITPFDETPDEKEKREKMKQEIEKITNPNPWDIKSLFENGGN